MLLCVFFWGGVNVGNDCCCWLFGERQFEGTVCLLMFRLSMNKYSDSVLSQQFGTRRLNVSCNCSEEADNVSWSRLDSIDLSYNELSSIDRQLFSGPINTVRYACMYQGRRTHRIIGGT